jgi:regulation of enolase protein 1 (concanavalin A-like superfamily)
MKALLAGLIVFALLTPALMTAEELGGKPLFEDKFDSTLGKGWSWISEDAKAWRIGKEGLEIRALPGHGTQRKNRLLGPTFKAGSEVMAEVFVEIHPTVTFEHAGLQCYFDEHNWVGLISESDVVLTHRKDDKATWQTLGRREDSLWVRLVISQGKAAGFYRLKADDEWKKLAECDLPSAGDFRFGLAAGGGPKDKEDWARFRDFRVLAVEK